MSIIRGDCIEEMKKLQENSIDSIVTDPPYGIGFMGEKWDKFSSKQFQDFSYSWGIEALRVLKHGSYCLAFSGTRTYHRMVCGLEDAGFNIKDMVMWCYGSGFPKSLDISKAIDKYYNKEREVIGEYKHPDGKEREWKNHKNASSTLYQMGMPKDSNNRDITKPNSKEAQQWDGWGTTLKPALEPIVVAQKPLIGTYAENVLKYGVGGINVDGCRIGFQSEEDRNSMGWKDSVPEIKFNGDIYHKSNTKEIIYDNTKKGRFPSNLLLDTESAEMLDVQSGILDNGYRPNILGKHYKPSEDPNIYSKYNSKIHISYNGTGGASRFFYCGKAHKSERNAGLFNNIEAIKNGKYGYANSKGFERFDTKPQKNNISTLKPINIMRYLVRLVTPPNGTVLDPFAGSGTTGIACLIEGFNYILIEKRKRFANTIIPLRLKHWSEPKNWLILKNHNALPKVKNLKKQKENNSIIQYINGVNE